MKKHRYTKEQKDFIRDNCKGKMLSQLQEMLKENFEINVTEKSVQAIMYRNGWKTGMKGVNTRFKKGQTSWCKGMKGLQLSGEDGWFKKGNLPTTHKPVGSESTHEGIIWLKIAEPNEWRKKHHYIWEQEHGQIPEGIVLRFADGNKMNVTLDNLFSVSRRVLSSVVSRGIEQNDPGLNFTVHKLAELELAIKDTKKRKE